jgi:hypothetical protein
MTLIANSSAHGLRLANFHVMDQNSLAQMHSKRGSVNDEGKKTSQIPTTVG